jgi:hypothetical protein
MKKAAVTLLPCAASVLYALMQLFVHAITDRMYFTSNFAFELLVYAVLGSMYVYTVSRVNRSNLRLAIVGLFLGLLSFFALGVTLFFTFEFSKDLSI